VLTETENANGGKHFDIKLADKVNLGKDTNKIILDGTSGQITSGPITINTGSNGTINGLTNLDWNPINPVAVSGQAATEDQLKKLNDHVNTSISNYGFIVTANKAGTGKVTGNTDQKIGNGDKITLKAGNNLEVEQNGKDFTFALNKDLTGLDSIKVGKDGLDGTPGKDGVSITGPTGSAGIDGQPGTNGLDGKIGISGKDGKDAVSISGKDGIGTIGLTGPKGVPGKDGKDAEAKIRVEYGEKGLDGNDGANGETKTRIIYEKPNGEKETVATLKDGLRFKGDSAKVIDKKLNETLEIIGGAEENNLTDGNIGVIEKEGKLEIKLSKDIKDITSIGGGENKPKITFGDTSINVDAPINVGDNQINNLKSGLDGTTLADASGDTLKNAVNVEDLKKAITENSYNFKITSNTDGGTLSGNKELKDVLKNSTITLQSGKNLNINQEGTKFTYSLNKDLTGIDSIKVGKDGLDGTPGKDGVSITGPTGAAGIDGQPGTNGLDGKIGISGKDGKDAVSISGKDGVGTIGLTGPKGVPGKDGKDAEAKIRVEYGEKGLDGNDGANGETKTRIIYEKPNGEKETVATLKDGLKFAGDNGTTVIDKKLNEKLEIVGGADETKLSDRNIGINAKEGKLEVKLSKELTGLTSSEFKNASGDTTTINGNGITIDSGIDGKANVSLTSNGLDNGGNKITNVADGEVSDTSKEAVNGS
ncbi:hypothetical protein HP397_06575, partial [Streptobacillus felis]|nr:hypothetical protein [Streptobacillus felis]